MVRLSTRTKLERIIKVTVVENGVPKTSIDISLILIYLSDVCGIRKVAQNK